MMGAKEFPRRVQIVTDRGGSFKQGSYAYVVGADVRGGNHVEDHIAREGEMAYLVAKTKEARGGAIWFSPRALRFPSGRPASEARTLAPAWLEAMEAGDHARRLQEEANTAATEADENPRPFSKRANDAADALEVAADAWEVAGEERFANRARLDAAFQRAEAFGAAHPRVHGLRGWYFITDAEARELVQANGRELPEGDTAAIVRLGYAGPTVSLRRVVRTDDERSFVGQQRPWSWAVGGFR